MLMYGGFWLMVIWGFGGVQVKRFGLWGFWGRGFGVRGFGALLLLCLYMSPYL